MQERIVITSAVRTAIGDFGGLFKELKPSELLVPTMQEVAKQSRLSTDEVDEVIIGQCIQRTDEPNIARTAALLAGWDERTTGYTVQRQCASGLQAIILAAMQIQQGLSKIVVAGGVESMSTSPFLLKQHRWGVKLQHTE